MFTPEYLKNFGVNETTIIMRLLKNLPISYTARLKDIRLINFSVHPEELGL